ncbi:MAG: SMP-30/gluconolactonase/LRE family protein [Rhizobiaceae bacterium]|nr:SMP-30/gluconolactonase/LRE family protein [Rhizobiaceae bacterium]
MIMPNGSRNPGFTDVVGDTALETLASGLGFTEGPVWHPYEKWLVFSDIPENRMYIRTASGVIEDFRRPSNKANGNTLDREGRLLTCEHATSRVTRLEHDGSTTVLATHYQGKELNSPNDIVVATGGAIYFTDPIFGRMEYYGVPREPELSFRGIYRVDPDGSHLTLLASDFGQPNGLCFSLDESRLFVNDTERQHIRVFSVTPQGELTGGAVWAETKGEEPGAPDGMKIDSRGNLYCCGPGGIHVFDPSGNVLGVISTPEPCANFAFGDEDLKSLYITASSSLHRLRLRVPGLRLF